MSARLTHRNLVRVFDYVHETDGSAALVMEHLRGETLESLLARHGALPVGAAVACLVALLRGLEHAHERDVVHRDLKPSNVFLAVEPDGYVVPKLLDFGVAKAIDEHGILLTQRGLIVGTPAYMSPEQVRGEHVDASSDVFAAGAMLYEMLTGVLAFRAPSAQAAMIAVLQRELEPRPEVPAELWPVVERALQKDPAARYASATALRAALEEAAQYTQYDGPAALRELEPVVAELPPLPPRVSSFPSLTPPSLGTNGHRRAHTDARRDRSPLVAGSSARQAVGSSRRERDARTRGARRFPRASRSVSREPPRGVDRSCGTPDCPERGARCTPRRATDDPRAVAGQAARHPERAPGPRPSRRRPQRQRAGPSA